MFSWKWYQTIMELVAIMLVLPLVLPQDQNDWIDPHDMENFDSKKVERQFSKENEKRTEPEHLPCPKIDTDCETKLAVCKEENARLQHESQSCVTQPVEETPYFRQFIQVLVNHLKHQFPSLPDNEPLHYDMNIKLTAGQLNMLKSYTRGSGTVQDTSSVLGEMIQSVKILSHTEEPWINTGELSAYIVMILQVMCIVATAVVSLKIYFTLSASGLRLMILLSIFISVPWNWVHLYKVAVAKRMSEAMMDTPEECRPRDLTWQHNLIGWLKSSFTFQDDKCSQYHENLLVDPLWEVPPTKAVAVTLTKFLLEPVEYIAQAISKFFRGLLHDLPAQLWPVALGIVVLFLLVFLVLTLIMKNGYRIGFPFGLIRLEPTGMISGTDVQGIIEEQKQMIANMQSALQKVQSATTKAVTYETGNKEVAVVTASKEKLDEKTSESCNVNPKDQPENVTALPVETVGNTKEADS